MIIILKNIKQLVLIFIFLNSANVLNAQPLKKDYVRTAIELGLLISIEYDFFNLNSYQNKRIKAPNKFDNYFRDKLRWEKNFPSYLNKNSFFTEEEIAIYKGPTLVDSKILISNQKGMIIIIDADNGTEIDTLNFDELAIPPIPVNGSLLFLTSKGILSAYE